MNNLFAVVSLLTNKEKQMEHIFNRCINSDYTIDKYKVIESSTHFVFLSTYVNTTSVPSQIIADTVPVISNARIDNSDYIVCKNSAVKNPDDPLPISVDRFIHNAYLLNGDKLCSMLKGHFSFILWDEITKTLHAGLDAFNASSLHYSIIDNALYIASDAKVLSNICGSAISVNKHAVSQWLAGRPDPNISMFTNISRLPLGNLLTFKNKSVSLTKFWDIDANNKVSYRSNDAYQSHFFELLSNSVANCLNVESIDNAHPVFSQMSGGMDSTSITALANIEAAKASINLHTLSHSYKNTKSCDEMSNINDMISKLNLQHSHFIELDKFNDISFGELYPTDFDNPGIVLSPKYHEELTLMQSLHAKVLLTGNGGDEVCWGHSASYRSRLYKGEFGVINEVIKACDDLGEPVAKSLINLFVKPLIPQTMSNLVKFVMNKPLLTDMDNERPAWLSEQAIELLNNNIIVNPFNKTFEPAKFARYHGLKTTSTYNSMRSYQKVANGYGVDVMHPFFDSDVVEFSFAIPEKMLIQGSYPKWLLRNTMQDYLPESVVWNKHKVVFDHHFANLVRSNHKEIRALLTHEGLQDLGLLNNSVLLTAFDEIVNDNSKHLHVDMLYAILTQSWYQTHCI